MKRAIAIPALVCIVAVGLIGATEDRERPVSYTEPAPAATEVLLDHHLRYLQAEHERQRVADRHAAEDLMDETVELAHWTAEVERQAHERRVAEYLAAVEQARIAEERRAAEAERQRQAAAVAQQRQQAPAPQYGSGACGGDLPPCYVMMRESGGNIHAQNPRSTASGKWQFIDSTWGGYGGYAKARHAPESVQDERARQLWDNGRGCSHWLACG